MTAPSAALAIDPLDAPPDADVVVPGSKSITNRALLVAGLAAGRSRLDGVLDAADTRAMTAALRQLGVTVEPAPGSDAVDVTGVGGRLAAGPCALFFDQSGTTSRFLVPAVALGSGHYRLDGSEQLRARPFDDLISTMRSLGIAVVEDGLPGQLPLTVIASGVGGGRARVAADVSSQFASGLLMSAPYMTEGLTLELTSRVVSEPYIEMTAAMMRAFGADVEQVADGEWRVAPGGYVAVAYRVEPDASTASYFFAAAAVTGGRVRVEGLGPGSIQGDVAFVDLLEQMGASVTRTEDSIEVRGTKRLRGIDADLRSLSDTVPTLAVVAAFAEGPTRIDGVGFIRGKESDRIAAVVAELRRCGVDADETADGLVVRPAPIRPARIETYDDHRIAMSFALVGLAVGGIEIVDPGCVAKTFPDYFATLDGLRSRQ